LSRLYSLFFANLYWPIHDALAKRSVFGFSRILKKTQWLPRREVELLQKKNLRFMLRHAYETVPYYRRVFRERDLTPSDIKDYDDLVKLPTLTKADIRNNFEDLISRGFPRSNLVMKKSGGSGDQIAFFTTREDLSWVIAAEYRAYRWAGYRLGDPCYLFWGSPIDITKSSKIREQLTSTAKRVSVFSSYVVSDEVLKNWAHLLKKYNPEIIRGYASSIYVIAKYLLEKGFDFARPRAVITSAETLLDFMRKTIEEAFDCPVFDFYGSREIGSIAAECEEHSGYHISAENVMLEFVRGGEQVAVGEKGEILVTNLRNFGMPFIRYKIEDVGTPSDEACGCGRGLPLLSRLEGRVSQFMAIRDKDSGRILPVSAADPGFMTIALMHVPIESFRIIQESIDKIVIKAVKGKGYSNKHTDFLIREIRKHLRDDIVIEIEFVDYIPPLPSGKRATFISKIDPFKY
jgi:phenylacetate-CoA ligase